MPRPGSTQRSIQDLRFAVVGAYVTDCWVITSRIPGCGEQQEARPVRTAPGGKALNQAVALARLGARVSTIGVVGDDGDNAIVWHVDDDVAVTPATVRDAAAVIRQADAVLITFEMPPASICEAISVTKDSGALVIVQPAPPLATPPGDVSLPWHLVDVVVANEAEARMLLNDGSGDQELADDDLAAAIAGELNVPMVVVTLGGRLVAYFIPTEPATGIQPKR